MYSRSGGSGLQTFGVAILSKVLFENEQYFIILLFLTYSLSNYFNFYWPDKYMVWFLSGYTVFDNSYPTELPNKVSGMM